MNYPFSITKANSVTITKLLLNQINIKANVGFLKNKLELHPEYPSLLAISDCLREYCIPNQAYLIVKNKFDARDMEFPFIAHLNKNSGHFTLVHHIREEGVTYSDEKITKGVMPKAHFMEQWSGVALHATTVEKSGEPDYYANRLKEKLQAIKVPFLIMAIIASMLLSINYQTLTIPYTLLFLIKLSGLAISAILLVYGIDENNPFVQNLCSLGNKPNHCNAVLKSDAAKVNSWLSWSEVGFFYFSGSLLCQLLNPATIPVLTWLNLLALPYTVYSINYQYKAKNWCTLCCIIQILLWLEFLTAISFESPDFLHFGLYDLSHLYFNFNLSVFIIICLSLPITSWFFLRPFLLKSAQFKPIQQQLKKFKYNSTLFYRVLTDQPHYIVPDDLLPIVLGNPKAKNVITIVSNPFCSPCAKAHKTLDQWLQLGDDIKLEVIFTTADHDNDKRTQMARHVTALSLSDNAGLVKNALNDWYEQDPQKYDDWVAKYPAVYTGEMAMITTKQKAWCNSTAITFTPTILLNGYKLPEPYRLEDIKYLFT